MIPIDEITDERIIGFTSFNCFESENILLNNILFGENGILEKLKTLKRQAYGNDINFILFEIYIDPSLAIRSRLNKIGYYRPAKKAIGIPIIIEEEKLLSLTKKKRELFIRDLILKKITQLESKVLKNNFDFNIKKLRLDISFCFDI